MKIVTAFALIFLLLSIPSAARADEEPAPLPSAQTFIIDGKPAGFSAINRYGRNFVKLSELTESSDFNKDFILSFENNDYYPIALYARDNDFFIAYDVDSNTVVLDTSKPWHGGNEEKVWYFAQIQTPNVDASGRFVSPLEDPYRISVTESSAVSPTASEKGLTITARFERHPHAEVFRITEYASSPGFPVKKIDVTNTGVQFSVSVAAPGAAKLKDAIEPVLNKNNEWSDEFQKKQREVFNVTVNGKAVSGFLESGYLGDEEYYFWQFIFLEKYEEVNDMETVHIELNVK